LRQQDDNRGYCLNQLQRFSEAERFCKKAIEIKASWHNAYKNLGVSMEGQGYYVEAAKLYLMALSKTPADGRYLMHLEVLFH
jgi:Flp pilus assembly protein TadD